jgi:hypothetical protein
MEPPKEAKQAIESWLGSKFQDAELSAHWNEDRGVVLYRVKSDGPKHEYHELEITREAFEKLSAETITRDLEEQDVVDRLVADRTMRLTYYATRQVPPVERLRVDCDGRQYTIVRYKDSVRVLDEERKALENLPRRLTMSTSIFYRVWCDDIEKWRGTDQ